MDWVVAFIAKGPPRSTNRMPVSAAHGDGASEATARDAPTAILQERLCHARPYQVDRASTRDQSEVLKFLATSTASRSDLQIARWRRPQLLPEHRYERTRAAIPRFQSGHADFFTPRKQLHAV